MIPFSDTFDQSTLARMIEHDKVTQRYRAFFALIDWQPALQREAEHSLRGRPAHPISAYIKAFLVKLIEDKEYVTQLRDYRVSHPLLIIELGFRLHLDPTHSHGFDVERTLPKKRWFNEMQRTIDHHLLQDLLARSVRALQNEIPGLGETIAVDVKLLSAWVRENNRALVDQGEIL